MGHWKSECPNKNAATPSEKSASGSSSVPASFAVAHEVLSELADIPEIQVAETRMHSVVPCLTSVGHILNGGNKGIPRKAGNHMRVTVQYKLTSALRDRLRTTMPRDAREGQADARTETRDIHFASSGTNGVVDLGASQTVIGSHQVKELLEGMPDMIRQNIRRAPCHLVFRLGNQQTLTSRHALLLPFRGTWFRIAVVPGRTPFLLSSAFLQQIKAVIDTEGAMWSKMLQKTIQLERSTKNLLLMDTNQLWEGSATTDQEIPSIFREKKQLEVSAAISNHTPVRAFQNPASSQVESSPSDTHLSQLVDPKQPKRVTPESAFIGRRHVVFGPTIQSIPPEPDDREPESREGDSDNHDQGRAGHGTHHFWTDQERKA